MKKNSGRGGRRKNVESAPAPTKTKKPVSTLSESIQAWEDDPRSGARPVSRPIPHPEKCALPIKIEGPRLKAQPYKQGSPGFRYWCAAEALERGSKFWSSILPEGITWQASVGSILRVKLDAGVDLNAYYDRTALWFFHDDVPGGRVYSGESPDIVCHELGHAVLDALQPDLWDALSADCAAFHEAFGDISAILSAIQLRSLRQAILLETDGRLYRSSRLSRVAEELGWAIRTVAPHGAEQDCLRNAVNAFFYRDPTTIPPSGPAEALTAEPHSFSRVFTGAFFEMMAKMLSKKAKPMEEDLLEVGLHAAQMLVMAIQNAPVVAEYYSQIAAHMIEADSVLFKGRYNDAVTSSVVRHGLLSLEAATTGSLPTPKAPTASALGAAGGVGPGVQNLASLSIRGERYGFSGRSIVISSPAGTGRFAVAPSSLDLRSRAPQSNEAAATNFLDFLFVRGRVDVERVAPQHPGIVHVSTRKTHELLGEDHRLRVARLKFDCGLDAHGY